jgi:hypothetical protein
MNEEADMDFSVRAIHPSSVWNGIFQKTISRTLMILFFCLPAGLLVADPDLRFTTTLDRSAVDGPGYSLNVQHDLSVPATSAVIIPEGWDVEWSIKAFSLVDGGIRYSFDFERDPPDIYPITTGPVFNELHLVNVVLRADNDAAWPGLAELSFYGHSDRLYVKVRFVTHASDGTSYIIHNDDGIASDNFVYEVRDGFGNFFGSSIVSSVQFQLECSRYFRAMDGAVSNRAVIPSAHMGFLSTSSETGVFSTGTANTNVLNLSYALSQTWNVNETHEFGFMAAPGDDEREVSAVFGMHDRNAGLSIDASGRTTGFAPMRGIWEISVPFYTGTDKGVVKNTDIVISNAFSDPVSLVVDHRNSYGGFSASYLRDLSGNPMPVDVQHYVNYPENAETGERGGGRIYNRFTVPGDDTLSYTVQTFYRGGSTNSAGFHYDWIQRDTLSHRPNLQAISHYTINRQETLTIRHDPLSATDWRKHPDNLRDEFDVADSASAARTEFLQIQLAAGETLRLVSTDVGVSLAGPFLVEEIHSVKSIPEGVEGSIRLWSAAWMDEAYGIDPFGEGHSRWAAEVDLTVTEDLSVDTGADIPISVLSMHRSAPGYFKSFGYTPDGQGTQGLDISSETHLDSLALSTPFWAGFYNAQNLINRKSATTGESFPLPYSDVTGNPALAVWNWRVELNGYSAMPVLKLDAWMPPTVDRNWYVKPSLVPSTISSGSRIAYKLMAATGGDSSTGLEYGEHNFNTWKDIQVTAVKGTVLSDFPPRVMTDSTGCAEFTVTGGTEWIPVTVVGVNPDITQLSVESGAGPGSLSRLFSVVPGEPWYQIRTDPDTGRTSISLPVHTPDTSLPRSRYVKVVSGTGSEDADGDGIANALEGSSDADWDGIPNYMDTDSDGNGIGDFIEGTVDTDGDGIQNYLDSDNDGDLADDLIERLGGGFINDGFHFFGFDQDGATGRWEFDVAHLSRTVVTGGIYSATVLGNDSKLMLHGLNISGSEITSVLVCMRRSTGSGSIYLYWANEEGGFSSERSAGVPVLSDGQFHVCVFDLRSDPGWIGKTITDIRIDPINETGIGGTVDIDWICLSDGDLDNDSVSDVDEISLGDGFADPPSQMALTVFGGESPDMLDVRGQFHAHPGLFYRLLKKTSLLEKGPWEELLFLGPYALGKTIEMQIEKTDESASFYRIAPF